MATLANVHGGSFVSDIGETFGLGFKELSDRKREETKTDELEAGILAGMGFGAMPEKPEATGAMGILGRIAPGLAQMIGQTGDDPGAIAEMREQASDGMALAAELQGIPDHNARVEWLSAEAGRVNGEGGDVQRIVQLANMDPDQLSLELSRMQVTGQAVRDSTPEIDRARATAMVMARNPQVGSMLLARADREKAAAEAKRIAAARAAAAANATPLKALQRRIAANIKAGIYDEAHGQEVMDQAIAAQTAAGPSDYEVAKTKNELAQANVRNAEAAVTNATGEDAVRARIDLDAARTDAALAAAALDRATTGQVGVETPLDRALAGKAGADANLANAKTAVENATGEDAANALQELRIAQAASETANTALIEAQTGRVGLADELPDSQVRLNEALAGSADARNKLATAQASIVGVPTAVDEANVAQAQAEVRRIDAEIEAGKHPSQLAIAQAEQATAAAGLANARAAAINDPATTALSRKVQQSQIDLEQARVKHFDQLVADLKRNPDSNLTPLEQKAKFIQETQQVPYDVAAALAAGVLELHNNQQTGIPEIVNKITRERYTPTSLDEEMPSIIPAGVLEDMGFAIDPSMAFGGTGFGLNLINTIAGAVSNASPAGATDEAIQAITNLGTRTMLALSAEFAGRPSNLTRQRIEDLTATPASVFTGKPRATIQFKQMRSLIAQAIQGANAVAEGGEGTGFSAEDRSEAAKAIVDLVPIWKDYDRIIGSLEGREGMRMLVTTQKEFDALLPGQLFELPNGDMGTK